MPADLPSDLDLWVTQNSFADLLARDRAIQARWNDLDDPSACEKCGGTGVVHDYAGGKWPVETWSCDLCGGTGHEPEPRDAREEFA